MKTFEISCAGYSVTADWYDGDPGAVLLALPGWLGSRETYQDLMSALTSHTGLSGLVFEYSGHGESPIDIGQTRPAQHFLEAICVFDWLQEHHPSSSVTVMGTSYGGFLAAQLAEYRAFAQLVLRAPALYQPSDFYALQKNIDRHWTDTVFRKDKAQVASHPLFKQAPNFKGKTLVIVHELDEAVPAETTDAYIAAFGADGFTAKGFPHSAGELPKDQLAEYQKTISAWIKQ